jgi:N-acetylglucosamine-6-phosphate deacetylase
MASAEFFDLQVNGFAGVDFNSDELTTEGLHAACQKMRDGGVAGFLATIITDELETMCARISRVVEFRERDALAKQMIAGLHVEGPFINPKLGFAGAHPPDVVRPADLDSAKKLIDAGNGLVRLVTLAPECDTGCATIAALSCSGVVVSAGHSDADLKTLNTAIDAGLSMFTHLGNGCPRELPRHDNIIQRVLSLSNRLKIGFIADGAHIPLFALKNYLAAAELKNCFIVSDAMSAAGLGPGVYRLGRNQVAVGEDAVARSPEGYLVGSAVTMQRSAELLRTLGFSDADVRWLTLESPRRAARIE